MSEKIAHKQTSFENIGISVRPDVTAASTGTLDIWRISETNRAVYLAFMGDRPINGFLLALSLDNAAPSPIRFKYPDFDLIKNISEDLDLADRARRARKNRSLNDNMKLTKAEELHRDHLASPFIGKYYSLFDRSRSREKWLKALNSYDLNRIAYLYRSLPDQTYDDLQKDWAQILEQKPFIFVDNDLRRTLGEEEASKIGKMVRGQLSPDQLQEYAITGFGRDVTVVDFATKRVWPKDRGSQEAWEYEVKSEDTVRFEIQHKDSSGSSFCVVQAYSDGGNIGWNMRDYGRQPAPRDKDVLYPLLGWENVDGDRRLLPKAEVRKLLADHPQIAAAPHIKSGDVNWGSGIVLDLARRGLGFSVKEALPLEAQGVENNLMGGSVSILGYAFQKGIFSPRIGLFQALEGEVS